MALPERTERMRELALFAGIGGGLLGTHLLGWRPVCAVEKEPYCREVLLRRQRDGVLPLFPIWDDVRTFDGRPWRGIVDVVTFGDPCQSNSNARRNGGTVETLAGHALRIVHEVRPSIVLRENPAHIRKDAPSSADWLCGRLNDLGYTAAAIQLRACCVGCDHQRKRMFVPAVVADPDGEHVADWLPQREAEDEQAATSRGVVVENRPANCSPRGRTSHGYAAGLERFRAIGNAQVPAVVRAVGFLLSGAMK